MPKKKKRKIYNLTLHNQQELSYAIGARGWDVETVPRLRAIKNPQDWTEIKEVIKEAIKGIPPGSCVLIGGMTQICVLIAQLNLFNLYYVKLDYSGSRVIPVDISAHEGWSREERYDLKN